VAPAAYLLHWADSEVARVVCAGDDVLIHLAAAQVQVLSDTPAGPGHATVGHVRHLVLRLVQAVRADAGAPLGDAVGRLAQGQLRWARGAAGGVPLGVPIGAPNSAPNSAPIGAAAGTLAVPCTHEAPLQLALAFANGTPLDITASGLQARFSGDPAYRPSLAC